MSTAVNCDVLIIGSGAGGLTAAVTASMHCRDIIVVEKAAQFGGTSALSGGWIWVPMSPAAVRDGVGDSREAAQIYVQAEAGKYYDAARVTAYLDQGPRMIELLERDTAVRFVADHSFSDYHPDQTGGMKGGRSLIAAPYDARELGLHLAKLKPPLKQTTFMGMAIGSGLHLKHFLNATRSFKSAALVAGLMGQYGHDLIRYGRSVRLYNGNALMARLAKSAYDKGVQIWLSSNAVELIVEDGAVHGARIRRDGHLREVRARKGVILAAGGFSQDPTLRPKYFPKAQPLSFAPQESAGDGIRMALQVGASMCSDVHAVGYSAIFSQLRGTDDEITLYPHFIDRAKPGVILVNSDGRRFCNEANSYHDVAQTLIAEGIDGEARKAFFIADHKALRRYGLGAVRPAPFPVERFVRSGYLHKASTIAELGKNLGINARLLEETVAEFNHHARYGRDPLFSRGSSAYNAYQGDALHQPNPCLAPLETGPVYAVEVCAGDFGTFAGLSVDASARVLDRDGRPIARLFAVGNDSVNVFRGACLGAGVTIGPAMVFGFIAGQAITGSSL